MSNGTLVAIGIVLIVIVAVLGLLQYLHQNNLVSTSYPGQQGGSGQNQSTSDRSTAGTTTTQQSGNSGNATFGYYSFSEVALNATIVTASPANLSQISQISKFRSCAGHDFSGYDFNGTLESARSMKHYFATLSSEIGLSHTVQMFAPFNGTLIYDNKTLDYPNGDQIVVKSAVDPVIGVELFHIDLLPGITVGTTVRSGQLIGYKNASEYSGFDVAYGPLNSQYPCGGRCQTPMTGIWDSIFNHMTKQVLNEYANVGVTQSNVIVPEAYRNANPCIYPNETNYGSSGVNAIEWSDPKNWVNVT